jgi:hypothetical protein
VAHIQETVAVMVGQVILAHQPGAVVQVGIQVVVVMVEPEMGAQQVLQVQAAGVVAAVAV